jgi:hypothetical protein
MKLFNDDPTSTRYQTQRVNMVDWMVSQCGCEATQAGQCLNDIENHSGSTAGGNSGVTALNVTVQGTTYPVFHHSAGITGTNKTCTAFWIQYPVGIAKIVALAQHTNSSSYRITWVVGNGFTFVGTAPSLGKVIQPF